RAVLRSRLPAAGPAGAAAPVLVRRPGRLARCRPRLGRPAAPVRTERSCGGGDDDPGAHRVGLVPGAGAVRRLLALGRRAAPRVPLPVRSQLLDLPVPPPVRGGHGQRPAADAVVGCGQVRRGAGSGGAAAAGDAPLAGAAAPGDALAVQRRATSSPPAARLTGGQPAASAIVARPRNHPVYMSDLQDLVALIRADTPLIVIKTPDEMRVVELFRQSLTRVWRSLYRWTITEGLRRMDLDGEDPAQLPADAGTTLAAIRNASQRGVYLLLDFHPYLGYAGTQRQLRDILQQRDCLAHTVVLVGHRIELPRELDARAARLRLRLPDGNALLKLVREEIAAWQRQHEGQRVEADEAVVRRIVRNLQGLDVMDARRIARHLIHDD